MKKSFLLKALGLIPWTATMLVLGACTVIYLAGLNRGFDFTDEGSYYLSFAHPENVPDSQTSFHCQKAQSTSSW